MHIYVSGTSEAEALEAAHSRLSDPTWAPERIWSARLDTLRVEHVEHRSIGRTVAGHDGQGYLRAEHSTSYTVGFETEPRDPQEARRSRIRRAQELRARGLSLYAIALELGVSKDWLREYAGL